MFNPVHHQTEKERETPFPSHKQALYICSPSDPNGAFAQTEECFMARTEVLKRSGFSIDIQRNLETIEQIAEYIKTNYPDGIDYLYFRMHGDPKTLCLSDRKGGRLTADLSGNQQALAHRICQAVKEEGVLVVESCYSGFGKENILKALASQTRSGVVSIGSQTEGFEIEFSDALPKHHRYILDGISSKQDQTKIYYQASSGKPVFIPVELLDSLIALGGMQSPEILDMYYRFLGERENPEDFALARNELMNMLHLKPPEELAEGMERLQAYFRSLVIDISRFDENWQRCLQTFSDIAQANGGPHFLLAAPLNPFMRSTQLQSNELEIFNIPTESDPWIRAYFFLLGIAALDRYQDVFSLLKPETSSSGFSAQSVYALSGLAFHPQFNQTIFDTIVDSIQTTKNSYSFAFTTKRLLHWVHKLVTQQDPCATAYITAMNQFAEGTLVEDNPIQDEGDLDSLEPFNLFQETGCDSIYSAMENLWSLDASQEICDKLLLGAMCHDADRIEEAIDMDWGTIDWTEFYNQDLDEIVKELLGKRQFSSEVLEKALEHAACYGRNNLIELLLQHKISEKGYVKSLIAAARNGWYEAVKVLIDQAPAGYFSPVVANTVLNSVNYMEQCLFNMSGFVEIRKLLSRV